MKKIFKFIILFLGLLFINSPICSAKENIEIKDVTVVESGGNIEIDELEFDNNSITSKIVFNKLNDFLTLNVEISNNSYDDYILEDITNANSNEYISIESIDIGEEIKSGSITPIRIKIKQNKELVNSNDINLNNLSLKLVLRNKNYLVNPPTTAKSYIVLIAIAIIMIILKIKNVKISKKTSLLLLLFLLIPIFVSAEQYENLTISFNNIEIKSEYLNYDITIDDGSGNVITVNQVYGSSINDLLPTPQEKEGYIFDSWIDQDGHKITAEYIVTNNTTIRPKYNLIEYSITYNLNGGKLPSSNPKKYTIEDSFTLKNPTKAGYTFAGWSEDGITYQTTVTISKGTTGNKTYTAHYSANDRTQYVVIHRQMNMNGEYKEKERETLYGATDTPVSPQTKDYTGFTAPPIQTKTIAGDGSTTFTYDYSRNRYTFTISDRTYVTNSSTANGEYYYGTTINVEAITRAGYTFKWSDNTTTYARSFSLSNNTTLNLIYTPKTNTPYKVVHKQMNMDGINYTTKDEVTLYGTTDTVVEPETNEYEGFTAPAKQSVTINGNGTTVVTYLYTRNKYNLTLEDAEYIETSTPSGEYFYGTSITLRAKEREDYVFTKWSNNATANPYTFTLTKNTTIKPIYNHDGFIVTFNSNGGSVEETVRAVEYDHEIGELPTGTKEGYYLDGWYTTPSGGIKVTETYKPTANITLFARWNNSIEQAIITNSNMTIIKGQSGTINISNKNSIQEELSYTSNDENIATVDNGVVTGVNVGTTTITITGNKSNKAKTVNVTILTNEVTISFETDGGSAVEDMQAIIGTEIGELPSSTKAGHNLDGWYTSATGGDKIESTFKPTENMILYARWSIRKYTLTIENSEYVITTTPSGEYEYNTEITLTAKDRLDYQFMKWSNNATTRTITFNLIEDTTIKPIYKQDGYEIIFNPNGGVVEETVRFVAYDEEIGELPTATKSGYLLEGWYTSLTNGTEVTPNFIPTGDIELYAKWFPDNKSAKMDGVYYATLQSAIDNVPKNGTAKNITLLKDVSETVSTYQSQNITIDLKNHTVTAVDNGNALINYGTTTVKNGVLTTNSTTNAVINNYSDGTVTIENAQIKATGKRAAIYNKAGTLYVKEGAIISSKTSERAAIHNLDSGYAYIWGGTIKSDAAQAINSESSTLVIGKKDGVYKSTPIIQGYSVGITTDHNYSFYDGIIKGIETAVYNQSAITKIEDYASIVTSTEIIDDITYQTLYLFKNNTFTITFDANGGTSSETTRIIIDGSEIGTLPTVERAGYYLEGWYTSIGSGARIDSSYKPTQDITLYAKWNESIESATITNTTITIMKTETETINISNKNDIKEDIIYSSNNSSIATVSNVGLVTGKGVGQTTILLTGSVSHKTRIVTVIVLTNEVTVTFNANGGSSVSNLNVVIGNEIGTLPTPTRTGYILDGWFTTSSTGGEKITSTYRVETDITLYARWTKSVELAEITSQNLEIDFGKFKQIGITNLSEIEPVTFTSQDSSVATVDELGNVYGMGEGQTTIVITGTRSNKTKIINIKVTIHNSVITFNANGGTISFTTKTVKYGEAMGDLPTGAKIDHYLEGWYTSLTNGIKITEEYVPNDDMELFAIWKKSVEAAIMNESMVLDIYEEEVINIENNDEIEEHIYTSDNQEVATVDASGKVTGLTAGRTTINIIGQISGKTKIINVEVVVGKTIIYDANGGTFENNTTQNSVRYKTLKKYSHTSNVDDTGKKLSNYGNSWTNANITGTDRGDTTKAHVITISGEDNQLTVDIYYNGESTSYDWVSVWAGSHPNYTASSNNSSAISGAQKLGGGQSGSYTVNGNELTAMGYKRLTVNSNSVTFGFKSDGSQWGAGYGYYAIVTGYSRRNDSNYLIPTIENEHFINWYKTPDFTTSELFNITDAEDQAVAYAGYGTTVTFNPNGGSEIASNTREIIRGNSIGEIPATTRENYYLDGWYTEIASGTKVESDYVPTVDTEIFAHWKKSVGFMSIEKNKIELGYNSEETINITNKAEIEETYTFTSNNSNVATVDETGKITATGEGKATITITGEKSGHTKTITVSVNYARYLIKLDANGGQCASELLVIKTTAIGQLPVAYLDHYYLDGWYTSLTNGVKITEDYVPTSDMTLYAKYIAAPEYTITFDADGGTVEESTRVVTADMSVGELPIPEKEGFNFIGWKEETDDVYYISTTMPTKDVTLKAQWSEEVKVARINTTYYDSLANAVAAAEDGNEIVLLRDVTETITNSKKITINLDKHKITGNITNNANSELQLLSGIINNGTTPITNNGTLIVGSENIKLQDGVEIKAGITGNLTSSKVIFNNGKIYIKSTTSKNIYGIYAAEIIMNNGEVHVETIVNYYYAYGLYGNTIVLNGGTVYAYTSTSYTAYGIYAKTKSTMNSGEITAISALGKSYGIIEDDGKEITINGGNIFASGQSETYGIYIDNGYLKMNNGSIKIKSKNNCYGIYTQEAIVENATITVDSLSSSSAYGIRVSSQMAVNNSNIYIKTEGYGYGLVNVNNSDNKVQINNISITIDAKSTAMGISSSNGDITFNDGTILSNSKINNAYGIKGKIITFNDGKIIVETVSTNTSNYHSYGLLGSIINMNGGYIKAKSSGVSIPVDSNASSDGNITINSGTLISEAKDASSHGVYCNHGNININNVYIDSQSKNKSSFGVYNYDGTSTINDGYIQVISQTTVRDIPAYGVYAYKKATDSIIINNGTIFTKTDSQYTNVYGAYGQVSFNGGLVITYTPYEYYNYPFYQHTIPEGKTLKTEKDSAKYKYTYLQGSQNAVIVTLDFNGGTAPISTIYRLPGTKIGTLPIPTKEGYYFDGWYSSSSGGTKIESDTVINSSRTIYAHWKKSIELAVFDETSYEMNYNEERTIIIVNANEIEEEYTFRSNDESVVTVDASGKLKAMEEGITKVSVIGNMSNATRNIEVKVYYQRYTISFNSNGGNNIDSRKVIQSNKIGELPVAYLDHYYLDGWYTSLTNGVKITEDYVPTSDMTLYAKYIAAPEYTITFDADGGTVEEATRVVTADMSVGELPIPEKEGFNFIGWKEETDDVYYISTTMPTKDVTLKAQWSEEVKVARINTTYYDSLANAVAAAEDGNEIVLLRDVTETITNSKKITINLDKHKITGNITNNANSELQLLSGIINNGTTPITNNGTLIVGSENIKLQDGVEIKAGITGNLTSSKVIFNNGKIYIKSTTSKNIYGIYAAEIIMNNGEVHVETTANYDQYGLYGNVVTLNGGIVYTYVSTAYTAYGIYTKSTATINSGEISSISSRWYAYAIYGYQEVDITINGGSIYTSAQSYTYGIYAESGIITMNNGTITSTSSGGNSYGIYGKEITIYDGTIISETLISSNNSYGIYSSSSTMVNGGMIYSKSKGVGYGIYNYGSIDIIMNNGSITVESFGVSYGIHNQNASLIANEGMIVSTSTSSYSYGFYCKNATINNIIIQTKSLSNNNSYGIYATNINMEGGSIASKTNGEAYGVYASGTENNINNGAISAESELKPSYGLYLSNDTGITTINNITILSKTNSGEYAYGAYKYIYNTNSTGRLTFNNGMLITYAPTLDKSIGIINYTIPADKTLQTETDTNNYKYTYLYSQSSLTTVTLNANGGNLAYNKILKQTGSEMGYLPTPVKEGYFFMGWYTSTTGGTKINKGTTVKSNMKVYAHWKKSIASATFEEDNIILDYGESKQIIITNANTIEEEYIFKSNNDSIVTVDSSGNLESVNTGVAIITIIGKTSNQTATINVEVIHKKYKVSFDSNGAEDIESITVRKNEAIGELPTPHLDHYDFDGWYTSLTNGVKIDEEYKPTSDITLYAKYIAAETYTITFDANGGVVEETTRTVSTDMAIGELPIPTKENSNFAGWLDEDENEYYVANRKPTKNVVLKAQWKDSTIVARINSTYYDTIAKAINAAATGDEIVLLTDRTENITINKEITFNLDNHKLTGTITNNSQGILTLLSGIVEYNNGTAVMNRGVLTVGSEDLKKNDGVEIIASSGSGITGVSSNSYSGKVIFNNGKITATSSSTVYGIYGTDVIYNSGSITIKTTGNNYYGIYGNKVTINGGSINATNTSSSTGSSYGISGSNITLNGGTILLKSKSSPTYGIYGRSTNNVNINAGSISVESSGNVYGICNESGEIYVNDGSISSKSMSNYSYAIYGKRIILENGTIISASNGRYNSYGLFGTQFVMINNGTIISTSQYASSGVHSNNGEIIMNNGTVLSEANIYESYGVYSQSNDVIFNNGQIKSKSALSNSYGIYGQMVTMNAGSIISESLSRSTSYGISSSSQVEVNKGSISSKSNSTAYGIRNSNSNTIINNGSITSESLYDNAYAIYGENGIITLNEGILTAISSAEKVYGIYGKTLFNGGLLITYAQQDENNIAMSDYTVADGKTKHEQKDTNNYKYTYLYEQASLASIRLNANGGQIESNKLFRTIGSELGELPIPTRKDYYFVGWYTMANDGVKVNSNTSAEQNMILYAHWKKSIESAVFEEDTIELDYDEEKQINILNKNEIEEDYIFSSDDYSIVSVDSMGKVKALGEGNTYISIIGKTSNHVVKLRIKVQYQRYIISFNSNGGNDINNVKIMKGNSIGTLPIAYKEHYEFEGWYTNLTNGTQIEETYVPTSDMTLYAKYIEAQDYTITFDANGGNVNETERIISADMKLGKLPIPTRDNYYFVGWLDEEGSIYYTADTKPTKNVTLKAQWSEIIKNARINSTLYDSLQAAIDAAVENDEIVLLRDIYESPTANKKITINLDNHILFGKILNNTNGNLTLLAGTIENNGVAIENNGAIIIGSEDPKQNDGVNIVANTYGIYSSNDSSTITINKGNITVVASNAAAYGIYGKTITMKYATIYVKELNNQSAYGVYGKTVRMNNSSIKVETLAEQIAYGVYSTSWVNINNSSVRVCSERGNTTGIYNDNQYNYVYNSYISSESKVGTAQVIGSFYELTMDNTIIESISLTSNTNYMILTGKTAKISNSRITLNSASTNSIYGIYVTVEASISDSIVSLKSKGPIYGFYNTNYWANIKMLLNNTSIILDSQNQVFGTYLEGGILTFNNGIIREKIGDQSSTNDWYSTFGLYGGNVEFNDSTIIIENNSNLQSTGIGGSRNIKVNSGLISVKSKSSSKGISGNSGETIINNGFIEVESSSKSYGILDESGGITLNSGIVVSKTTSETNTDYAYGSFGKTIFNDGLVITYNPIDDNKISFNNLRIINGKQLREETTSNNYKYAYLFDASSKVTITLDARGGTSSISTIFKTSGEKMNYLPTPVKTGYYFDGWYTSATGGTEVTTDTIVSSNMTIYAHWKKSIVSANISSTNIKLDYQEEKTINITNSNTIEEDYEFSSENKLVATVDQTGKVTAISEGTTKIIIKGLASNQEVEISITVEYTRYSISFNSNGGDRINTRYIIKSTKIDDLPVPYINRHANFDGWYTSLTNGVIIDKDYIPTSNMTLYAKWNESNSYTINFDANGGSVNELTRVVYEDNEVGSLPVAIKEGKYFVGWLDESNSVYFNSSMSLANNITLKAQWSDEQKVASNKTKLYDSLQSAIDDAKSGDEIILLTNRTEDISNNKKITLILNDKTLTGRIVNNYDGDLTVLSGIITNSTNMILNNGKLTIGKNDSKKTNMVYLIANSESTDEFPVIRGGKIVINNMAMNVTNKGVISGIRSAEKVVINNGTINVNSTNNIAYGIEYVKDLIINGAIIEVNSNVNSSFGIYNIDNMTINNIELNSNSSAAANSNFAAYGMNSVSKIIMNGGIISATNANGASYGMNNITDLIMNGGTISITDSITTYGISNSNNSIMNNAKIITTSTTGASYGLNTGQTAIGENIEIITTSSNSGYAYGTNGIKTLSLNNSTITVTSNTSYAYGVSGLTMSISNTEIVTTSTSGSVYGTYSTGSGDVQIDNVEITATSSGSTCGVSASYSGTMSLNSVTINSESSNNTSYGISGSKTMTIDANTSIISKGNSSTYGINGGNITLNGGTIKATNNGSSYAGGISGTTIMNGGSVIVSNNSTTGSGNTYGISGGVTMTGGTISVSSNKPSGSTYGISGSPTTINSGTVTVSSTGNSVTTTGIYSGEATINGGTITVTATGTGTGTSNSTYGANGTSKTSQLTFNGGTITVNAYYYSYGISTFKLVYNGGTIKVKSTSNYKYALYRLNSQQIRTGMKTYSTVDSAGYTVMYLVSQ